MVCACVHRCLYSQLSDILIFLCAAGLFHEPQLIGKAFIRKGDHFFNLEFGLDIDSVAFSEGDRISVTGFVAKVVRLEMHAKNCFIDIDRPACVSSTARGLNCYVEKVVKLRGKVFTLDKTAVKVHQGVNIVYKKKKQCLKLQVQSLHVNAKGYLTQDSVVLSEQ